MKRIHLVNGDITLMKTDAIVNAANTTLLGGGGVDGAIHRAAGPALLEACRALKGCPTGEARITPGFNLPARFIIHTVGPVWHSGKNMEEDLLRKAYSRSLELARDYDLKTVAFPNISTGVYGFPKEKAAKIALEAVNDFLAKNSLPEEVFFVAFDMENYELYKALIH